MENRIINLIFVISCIVLLNLNVNPNASSFNLNNPETAKSYRNNAIKIFTIEQFQNIDEDLDADYLLMNDIDASKTKFWNNGSGFIPIGLNSAYNGTLNGNGYTINNLIINREKSNYSALFYQLGTMSEITHLMINNLIVNGRNSIGGISISNHGNISDCRVIGNLNGDSLAGGISTFNSGNISTCSFYGNISAYQNVGGIVGLNLKGNVTQCKSSIRIKGHDRTGGLIGYHVNGTINTCFSQGMIEGNRYVGGLAGGNFKGSIYRSYSVASVKGNGDVGGFVGLNANRIRKCYSAGFVNSSYPGGGFVSINLGDVINCFWDKETSGKLISQGGKGYDTINMKSRSTFSSSLWDFDNIWDIYQGETYPYLRSLDYIHVKIRDQNVKNGYEDSFYHVDHEALSEIPGAGEITWTMDTDASDWLSLGINGVIFGTPDNDDVGVYQVNITATVMDRFLDSSIFKLEVINTNDPPIIITEGLEQAVENAVYAIDFEAVDIDPTNDILSWSLHSDSDFLEIDQDTGRLSGVPENDDVGKWQVWIDVSDGKGGLDELHYQLTVINTNDPPVILPYEVPIIMEDTPFVIDFKAIDIDPTGDEMEWIIHTEADFMTIDHFNGNISGIPTNKDVGTWPVVVNVSDGKGGYTTENLLLEVLNVNDDPVILDPNMKYAFQDEPFTLDLEAVDIDPTDDVLVWTLNTDASFLSIDGMTGTITGIPSNEDVGVWELNISVEDGNGGYDQKIIALVVNNVNDPPQLNVSEIKVTMEEDSEGISMDLDNIFMDIDDDPLTYTNGLSGNISIFIEDGIVTMKPEPDWSGVEMVTFTASDKVLSVSINFTLEVTPVNDPPTDVSIIARSSYMVGGNQTVDSYATDPDLPYGDVLTYSWSSNISGYIGQGRTINLSLPYGFHLITLTVTDSEGSSVNSSQEIEVRRREQSKEDDTGKKFSMVPIIVGVFLLLITVAVTAIFYILKRRRPDPTEEESNEFNSETERNNEDCRRGNPNLAK